MDQATNERLDDLLKSIADEASEIALDLKDKNFEEFVEDMPIQAQLMLRTSYTINVMAQRLTKMSASMNEDVRELVPDLTERFNESIIKVLSKVALRAEGNSNPN